MESTHAGHAHIFPWVSGDHDGWDDSNLCIGSDYSELTYLIGLRGTTGIRRISRIHVFNC